MGTDDSKGFYDDEGDLKVVEIYGIFKRLDHAIACAQKTYKAYLEILDVAHLLTDGSNHTNHTPISFLIEDRADDTMYHIPVENGGSDDRASLSEQDSSHPVGAKGEQTVTRILLRANINDARAFGFAVATLGRPAANMASRPKVVV